MEKNYEAPELTLIGEASEVVMGIGLSGLDSFGHQTASGFRIRGGLTCWP
jgi:hypothetical protein